MFLARIVFFRLHESPRYLVHAGRPQEAVKSLQMISKFNGSDLEIELDDVADHHPSEPQPQPQTSSSSQPPPQSTTTTAATVTAATSATSTSTAPVDIQRDRKVDETTIFDAGDVDGSGSGSGSGSSSPTRKSSSERAPLVTQYDSIGQTPGKNVLEGHSFKTPVPDVYPPPPHISLTSSSETVTNNNSNIPGDKDELNAVDKDKSNNFDIETVATRPRHLRHGTSTSSTSSVFTSASTRRGEYRRLSGVSSRRSSYYEVERKCRILPRAMRKPLALWWDRVSMVLEPEWFRTTILVWAVWFSMSLGASLFEPPLYLRFKEFVLMIYYVTQDSQCLTCSSQNC